MPARFPELLNHPQREHLAILLAQMEVALDELTSAAEPQRGPHHYLTTLDDDLPLDFTRQIQPIVHALRAHIARLAADFDLSARHQSRARLVGATITAALVRIEDSYANNLRGYGAVAPELANVLDPALRELHDGWALIHHALARASTSRTETAPSADIEP